MFPAVSNFPDFIFRDLYILDFLGMKDRYPKKDFEGSILREFETCLLELCDGFTFRARQYHLLINSDDYTSISSFTTVASSS